LAKADFRFSHRIRVRYAEIDGQMVVFNSRYLEYGDVAVTEYWRAANLRDHADWPHVEFHVMRAVVTFKAPIRFDEEIDLCARTARIGRSSMTTVIEIYGVDGVDDLRAEIEIVNVHVDLKTGKSQAIPAWICEAIRAFDAC
jgi:acyl-CoA thioester hydrolase